jgi:hypothetical protein
MNLRFDVVKKVSADLLRSMFGITKAHSSTPSEDISSAAIALVSFIRYRTSDEAHFIAMVDRVAEQMKYAVRDPNIPIFRIERGAKQ